jgi:hypothetical protein
MCYYYSKSKLLFFFFSAFALDWGRTWLNLKGKRATMHLVWSGLAGCLSVL